jgi:hypothetical protein
MNPTGVNDRSASPNPDVQTAFLALLPKIERVARFHFRHCPRADRKQDCISETVALSWLWHRRLIAQGRDPSAFATALARLAAITVKSGRKLCGQESARDALSPVCQRRRGFVVTRLPDENGLSGGAFADALRDNTQTPVPDQVQFRCDFCDWRTTLDDRGRRMVDAMMEGNTSAGLATRFGVTAGRIAQLRRTFHDSYHAYCGDIRA